MLKLKRTRAKKQAIFNREIKASKYIPYLHHWNKNTIITKNNELLQVIKVSGYSFETADDEDLDIKKHMLNMLFKGISSGGYSLYFHTIRRKTGVLSEDTPHVDPNVKRPNEFVDYISQEWTKKYQTRQAFVNELYITIIRKDDKAGAAIIEHMLKRFRSSVDKGAWEANLREMCEELDEVTGRVLSALKDYDPILLGVVNTENGAYCKILEFLGKIVNCGSATSVIVPTMTIDKYLPTKRIFFGKKAIEIRGTKDSKYAGMVSIKEYGPSTYTGCMDGFLQIPFECIISQSFSFLNRQTSISKMQLQQNRMIQAEDKAVSQIREISQALDMAMSGDISFGTHHLTVLVTADSLRELENTLSMVSAEMLDTGVMPVREKINLEPCFWGQLPGNEDFLIRKATINSLNLAGFSSLHNFPTGKAKDNHWGDSVAVFETTSGTPYHFNFHLRDVGHSLIIGPTGAGKTVLMNFLCAMAQKFKCRMFFFDKDRGAEIFIRAIGGHYTAIDPSQQCRFNPLQLENTGENRAFLLEWLKSLVTVHGENVTAEDIAVLSQAIEGNYKLNIADRMLSNVVAFLGIEGPGKLANRVAMWHSNGSHAHVFDNKLDELDLNKHRIFGFEMGELLKDSMALGPVLLYLFHKIRLSLDGTPTMIILDEAWALIDNPIFGPKIKDWLKVLRKLNTFVIFATQSVEDASKSQISDTLIQQTATQIFLPNLKATDVYRKAFMLSQREYSLIKTTDPSSRFFLIKQGVNAVIARIDLSGMTDIINVLSGRTETVILLHKIMKEVGEDPDKWLPIFYEKAKLL
jgi:type IV secretion system protein VirB4